MKEQNNLDVRSSNCSTENNEECKHWINNSSGCWECRNTYLHVSDDSKELIVMPTLKSVNTVGVWDAFR